MTIKKDFSDEELVSFLDGECDGELAAEISLALETDTQLQQRLQKLDLNIEDLRTGLDTLLAHAPKPELIESTQPQDMPRVQDNQKRRLMRHFTQIAALLLAGFIGYSLQFLQPATIAPAKKAGWIDMVVNYQQLYSKKTLSFAAPDPDKARANLAALSKELGREINFDTATSRSDIALKQTSLLSYNGKPLVQMAYLSKTGTPLALCIIKSKKQGDAPPKYQSRSNMQMAVWRKDGYAYLLIGGQDPKLIETVTKDLSTKL